MSVVSLKKAKNKELNHVTVTEVRITNDLSFMTIYYTFYQGKKANIEAAIEESNSFIRSALAKKLNPRKMPELIWKFDESLAYGNHIDDILNELKKEEKNKTNN